MTEDRSIDHLLALVGDCSKEHFGITPLDIRLSDIRNEATELANALTLDQIDEELGDLFWTTLALIVEAKKDPFQLIKNTNEKIAHRRKTYAALGRKRRVGILGGAFDPITIGHIKIATALLDRGKMFDEIWLAPAFQHMYNKAMVAPEHRLAMVQIAAKSDRRIKSFDYEIRNQFAGATMHFIQRLLEEDMAKHEYHFSYIIGADNANTFMDWYQADILRKMIAFVVVPRCGVPLKPNISWCHTPPHRVFHDDDLAGFDCSSTMVRKAIAEGNHATVERLLDPAVLDYIKEHELYKCVRNNNAK